MSSSQGDQAGPLLCQSLNSQVGARPNLLLVDNDPAVIALLAGGALRAGCTLEAAHSARSALRATREKSFCMVVLEAVLPDFDGFEVLRRLRARSDVPVLMLASHPVASDRIRALQMGADDYLGKPFETSELFARIRAILRRVQPSSWGFPFIVAGDVVLDARARRVTRSGVSVELTGSEFTLLQILMSYPGKVLSRQDLISHVLGRREYSVDRSIDTLVSNLRRKLGPLKCGDLRIRSVRGRGYAYSGAR